MMPRPLIWIVMVVAIGSMLGLLSRFIAWLNDLEGGSQALVVGLVLLGVPVAWWFIGLVARFISKKLSNCWQIQRNSAAARRERLQPQRKMTLAEARAVQPTALIAFNDAMGRMTIAAQQFKANTDAQVAKINAATEARPVPEARSNQLIGESARVVDRYSDAMDDEGKKLKRAVKQLGDA